MITGMEPVANTTLAVTIAGKAIGGITSFMVRMGKETVLVPSTEIVGAFVYTIQNVHYMEIERELYDSTSFSNLYNLSNFVVVTTHENRTVRYTGCEIDDIYEYTKLDGKIYEKIKISVDKRVIP